MSISFSKSNSNTQRKRLLSHRQFETRANDIAAVPRRAGHGGVLKTETCLGAHMEED